MLISNFTSHEMKAILKISDCELMHLRTSRKLSFIKKGNSYLYSLPAEISVLQHPVGKQLIDWYKKKHPKDINNEPSTSESKLALEQLTSEILIPIKRMFKHIDVTYGFTSAELKRYIEKNSPKGTAPSIDQHSACELNSIGNRICDRSGAACDILINGTPMNDVVRFIVKNLNFDRVYYYGSNRPLHISSNNPSMKHLQIIKESKNGRRYPAQKAFGSDTIALAESL